MQIEIQIQTKNQQTKKNEWTKDQKSKAEGKGEQ